MKNISLSITRKLAAALTVFGLLAAALPFGTLVTPQQAFAAGEDIELTPSSTSISPGDTVTVTVAVNYDGTNEINGINHYIYYDETAFTPVDPGTDDGDSDASLSAVTNVNFIDFLIVPALGVSPSIDQDSRAPGGTSAYHMSMSWAGNPSGFPATNGYSGLFASGAGSYAIYKIAFQASGAASGPYTFAVGEGSTYPQTSNNVRADGADLASTRGSISVTVAGTAPELQTIATTTGDGTYGPTTAIDVTATYDTNLDTSSEAVVTFDNGETVTLTQPSAGDATLTGTYTVGATGSGQDTTDLTVTSIQDGTNTNPVTDGSTARSADSSIPSGSDNLGDDETIVVDTTAPVLSSAVGAALSDILTLTYDEPLDTITPGTPSAWAVDLSTSADPTIDGVTISGSAVSVDMSAAAAVADAAGSTISYTAATTSGTEIKDPYGNNAADLSNQAITFSAAPQLTSFTSTTSDGTYGPGSTINITSTFDEALGTGSTMTVALDNGASVTLSTISGSTLTGTYTVGATGSGQDSSDLTVASITSGDIRDATQTDTQTSGFAVPATNIATGSALVIDTTAPTLQSFTSSTADATYVVSNTINVTATYDEPVTGTLSVVLDADASGSTSVSTPSGNTLTGNYTVATGDSSTDLTVASFSGTVTDAAGNAQSSTTLPATNIAAGSAIQVDAAALLIEFDSASASDVENTGGNLPSILVGGGVTFSARSVDISVSGSGTATAATDFTAPTTVTIPAADYSTAQTIAIPSLAISADTTIENDETIILGISPTSSSESAGNANGDGSSVTSHTYTITNDDQLSVGLSSATGTATDEATNANFPTLTFTGTIDSGVSAVVELAVNGAGATTAGSLDYSYTTESITITDSSVSPITLTAPTLISDTTTEGDETIEFTLTTSTASTVALGTSTFTYTLPDDDNGLAWSGFYKESTANTGALLASGLGSEITASIVGDTFAAGTLNEATHYTVTNLPPGLSLATASVVGNVATFVPTGSATNNAVTDSVTNLTITFLDAAFTGGSAAAVTGSTNATLEVEFVDSTDTDGDGVLNSNEDGTNGTNVNSGDADNNGTADVNESNVGNIPANSTEGTPAKGLISNTAACVVIEEMQGRSESSVGTDSSYSFPLGMLDFQLDCNTPGSPANVTVVYDQDYSSHPTYPTSSWVFRKFNGSSFVDMNPQPTIGSVTYGVTTYTTATFDLTDGGINDSDNSQDANIEDPFGPAIIDNSGSSSSGGGGGGGGSRTRITIDTPIITSSDSPRITGTVTTDRYDVVLTVDDVDYPVEVDIDTKTWELPAGTLPALAAGDYEITASIIRSETRRTSATATLSIGGSNDPLQRIMLLLRLISLIRDRGLDIAQFNAQDLIVSALGASQQTPMTPMTSTPIVPAPTGVCTQPFAAELTGGDRGEEVRRVQEFLNTYEGESIPTTGFYGRQTSDALVRFQEKYFDEILAPWNFSKGTGIWGPTSIRKANQILGCN